jgi:hypothetical protein
MLAAAELFPIRQVCAFGGDLPDGVVPLDDIFTRWDDLVHAAVRPGSAAAHVTSVTFDVTAAGIIPIARNAAQLIAGGRAVALEAEIAPDAAILSTIPPSSFAGIALGVVPWLLSGGTLALHHGCDLETLDAQSQAFPGAALTMPGPALAPLAEAGRLLAFKTIAALWRSPERLAACAPWYQQAVLIDVAAFGEIGVIAGRRQANGKPAPIPLGAIGTGIETARTRAGTLALRGPMVPTRAFPSGQALSPDVFLDTGFTCVRDGEYLAITGPSAGVTTVGGYRFAQVALDAALGAALADIDAAATVMAVPDALLGQRLAGNGADPQAIVAALRAQGANPLITGAFGRHAA